MPSADGTLSRHGRSARAPNSSARAGFSVSTVHRSIMLMRDTNFFQEAESKSRILGGLHPNRTRGRKARREGGGILTPRETNSLFGACLSKTNGLIERPRARRALIRSLSANLAGVLSLNLPERIDIRSLEDASACFISKAHLHICIKTRFIGQNSAIKWRFGENVGGGRSCGKLAASKVAGEG